MERVFRKRNETPHSDAVSELCDGLARFAMDRPYDKEGVKTLADIGHYWLNNQSRESFEEVKEEYKNARGMEEDSIYLKQAEDEFKRFGEPSTAIAAYFMQNLAKDYSPNEIAVSLSLALFDRRVPLSGCQSFVEAFEKLYLKGEKRNKRSQVDVEAEERQDVKFPREVTLRNRVTAQYEGSNENPDVGWFAFLRGEQIFEEQLLGLLREEISKNGGLDGLVLDIRRVDKQGDLKFKPWKCACLATCQLTYEVDVAYLG